jgi:opacity protein-like surface antigen
MSHVITDIARAGYRHGFVVGLTLVLFANSVRAATDLPPDEPFSGESGTSLIQSEQLGQIFGSDNQQFVEGADAGAGGDQTSGKKKKKTFSLWEGLGRFFELGASGDPNHLSKVRISISPTVGYDTNVLTTKEDPIASATSGFNGTAAYNFGSDRMKLSSSLSLGATYYQDRPGDKTDYNGSFGASTSYYLTRRVQVTGAANISYLSQPSPLIVGGVQRFSGDYTVARGELGLNYSLRPRWTVRLGYSINGITYSDSTINQQAGFREQTATLGLNYLFTPRVTLTAEYRYNPLTYHESNMNSVGNILTLGFVTTLTPKFKWTFQAGVEERTFPDPLPDATSTYLGPFLETNLEYDFSPGSSVAAALRYGTEPSGIGGVSISQTLRGSLGCNYSFSGRLSCSLGVAFEHDHYDQPGSVNDYSQVFYSGYLGLRYQFNPDFALTARYEYSAVDSEQDINNYTRDITTLGLELLF